MTNHGVFESKASRLSRRLGLSPGSHAGRRDQDTRHQVMRKWACLSDTKGPAVHQLKTQCHRGLGSVLTWVINPCCASPSNP